MTKKFVVVTPREYLTQLHLDMVFVVLKNCADEPLNPWEVCGYPADFSYIEAMGLYQPKGFVFLGTGNDIATYGAILFHLIEEKCRWVRRAALQIDDPRHPLNLKRLRPQEYLPGPIPCASDDFKVGQSCGHFILSQLN